MPIDSSFSRIMLYWQGYQGQFAALRSPTRSAETELFPGMPSNALAHS